MSVQRVGFVLAISGALSGCAGPHLDPNFGLRFHEAFARQAIRPLGTDGKPPMGLDTQEAQIILDAYRKRTAAGSDVRDPASAPQYLIVNSPDTAPGAAGTAQGRKP